MKLHRDVAIALIAQFFAFVLMMGADIPVRRSLLHPSPDADLLARQITLGAGFAVLPLAAFALFWLGRLAFRDSAGRTKTSFVLMVFACFQVYVGALMLMVGVPLLEGFAAR
jgi:hypothetical protein